MRRLAGTIESRYYLMQLHRPAKLKLTRDTLDFSGVFSVANAADFRRLIFLKRSVNGMDAGSSMPANPGGPRCSVFLYLLSAFVPRAI